MCGACGRQVQRDGWSDALSTTRARWLVARLVNDYLRDIGHPARIGCSVGSWVVRGSTGRMALAETATDLWAAVSAVRAIGREELTLLDGRGVTSTSQAVVEAARAALDDGP